MLGLDSEHDAPVHGCCGCSCDVCEHGHSSGNHTDACAERFWAEAVHNGELSES